MPWTRTFITDIGARSSSPAPGARVGLEALDRALDRPGVVPAEHRPQHGGQDAEQRAVGDHPPVEVDVDSAVRGGERPDPLARQVADDADLEFARAVEANDLRARLQVVGEAALELLARDAAHLRRAVCLDRDVDG